ncbi:MAG: hypothetical protein IPG79_02955 [Saprospiraceae bacterium]|nr:hypothetical protein [Saprospiraceae bacterium]
MIRSLNYTMILVCVLVFSGCESFGSKKDGKVSLHKYGIPVFIKVPDNVTFSKASSGKVQSLTITDSSDFNLQVLMSPTGYSQLKNLKLYHRDLVTNNPYFIKIVEDYDEGFIFELLINDVRVYDFRKVVLLGDKEIVFQAGPTCQCTEKNVMNMYSSLLK